MEDPQMMVEGVKRSDIMQGVLGDCWFLSSCGSICDNKEIMSKVSSLCMIVYRISCLEETFPSY